MVFPVVMNGCESWPQGRLSAEEPILLNCGAREDSWGSLGQQRDQTSQIWRISSLIWIQHWIFTGRTDAEAETPILWPPDAKNWLIWKDPDAGKDCRQEKGTTEDEMVGWHHRLDGREFDQIQGVGDGLESLACCSPWVRKASDMIEQLNWILV